MALWTRKKPTNGESQPPQEPPGSAGSDDGFKPDPEKARKWFDFARSAASSFNFDYALKCFANGIRLDPEMRSAHEEMYAAAVQYCSREGEPASGRDIREIDGSHPIHKFAAAEFAWMKDLNNPSLAMKFIEATVKAGQLEIGQWHAARVLKLQLNQKKPSKSTLVAAVELFEKTQAWNEMVAAGEAAMRIDPTDSTLANRIKDAMAQRAMDQAGYAEAGGKEGGYRKFVVDLDKQRELQETESLSASLSAEERNLERAKRDYQANPSSPDAINRYAQLLKKRATPEAEEQAHEIYLAGFKATNEYRFRMAAGDIRIEQAARRVEALRQESAARPGDERLRAEHQRVEHELRAMKMAEFTERVAKYPTDRRFKSQLGEVLFDEGKFGEAMAQFQAAKDEPKLRLKAGYMLGRSFAAEGWHAEAIGEFREALEKMDPSERDLENHIRYDLMESLMAQAREARSADLAREALGICSDIARKDITFRDIRVRRNEIGQLIKELGG